MTLSALGSAIASPLLRATNLARRYGEVEALSSCALSVDAGEIVAIVGANGCGKSTLLRALADIVPNVVHGIVDGVGATGTVEVDGRVLARGDAARVRAFVPQRPVVAADFTAREVVRLGRFARGADEAAVDRALSAVGLEARGARPMHALSGGERQRVAVARALAQVDGAARPILLLDEPFSGIDPAEVARIVASLRALVGRGAVVLSLHDPGLARVIATRAIVMQCGRVVADGPSHETLTSKVLTLAYGHPIREHHDWLAPELPAMDRMRTC